MINIKAIGICLVFLFLLGCDAATAGELQSRLQNFPKWEKLSVPQPVGDLVYPDWMAGNWQVTSTLLDLAAPLAPDIVTPGFEGNRSQLHQPINFAVRFVQQPARLPRLKFLPRPVKTMLVADRAFNSLNLTRAYLGDRVIAVKVDPNSPNRQITFLRGERQLVSIVTGRAIEKTLDGQFVAAEVFQQLFKGGSSPYFNYVESTTAYHLQGEWERRGVGEGGISTLSPAIIADQVTAVYLSPQDPDYFTAGSRPVALYRYKLEFFPPSRALKSTQEHSPQR